MMYPTGSRSLRRQHEPGAAVDLAHPAQLRAIPHNATLQQLGYLANTLAGAGRAIRKNPMTFGRCTPPPRAFGRVFGLIAWALAFSDTDVLKAYVDTLDPGLWLLRMAYPRIERQRFDELRAISRFIEGHARHDRLNGILRTLERDLFDMLHALAEPAADGDSGTGGDGDAGGGGAAHDGEDGNGGAGSLKVDVPETMTEDLRLLHVIRITLIQRIYMLATHIPEFSLRYDLSPEELRTRILRLEIEEALETLCMIFPQDDTTGRPEDFGEPATYESDTGQSYAREHARSSGPWASSTSWCAVPARRQPHHRRNGLIDGSAGASPRRQVRPHHLVDRGRGRVGVLAPLPEVEADADPFEGAAVPFLLGRRAFAARPPARVPGLARLGAGTRHVRMGGVDEPSGKAMSRPARGW